MQHSDDFAMQGWLYLRVIEPLSAGDWIYVLAMRTVSLPTAPHPLILACCLVGERLTPWTAETLTRALNPLREQGLNAQEAFAVPVQQYLAAEEEIRTSQARSSLLIDLPWTACGHSDTEFWSHIPALIQRPVWSLQTLLLHWSQVGAPDDLLATTYQEQIPGRLWYLLLPPQWQPLDKIASYNAIVTADRPPLSRAQKVRSCCEQACQQLRTALAKARVAHLASEDRAQGPSNSSPADSYTLRKTAQFWEINYEGETKCFKHTKGLSYLAYLLGHPHRPFPVLELVQLVERGKATEATGLYSHMSNECLAQENLYIASGEIREGVPPQVMESYKAQYLVLEKELEEAKQNNDIGRLSHLEEQHEALIRKLAEAVGYRGRRFKRTREEERERLRVRKLVDHTIELMQKEWSLFGTHLDEYITLGFTLEYRPPAGTRPWHIC